MQVAKAQVKAAAATYAAAAQDLMLRTASAYFDVLQAEDTLRYTEAEKAATARELDQAQQRYQVGLDAITDVYNAQASYDAILAREIANKNDILNAREKLREITGVYYENLATLKPNMPLLTPVPNNINTWVNAAVMQNITLQGANYTVIAARENIRVNFAGHMPILDAIASYQRSKPSNQVFIAPSNSESEQGGLQLSLPIYQGGLVTAQTQQAKYDYQKSIADREDIYRQVYVNTRQSFNNIIAGISKIKADRQTIISNQSSVDSTEAALQVGTRTIVDLLNAQQNLFAAESILSQDQYAYLINTLNLKSLAGTLSAIDLMKINRLLAEPSVKVYVTKTTTASTVKNGLGAKLPDITTAPTKTLTDANSKNPSTTPASNIPATTNTPSSTASSPVSTTNTETDAKQNQNTKPATNNQASSPSNSAGSSASTPASTTNNASSTAASYYVIELVGSHEETDIKQFIVKSGLDKNQVQILSSKTNDGKNWYALVYGKYATEAQAEAAIKTLPAALKVFNPWIHEIK